MPNRPTSCAVVFVLLLFLCGCRGANTPEVLIHTAADKPIKVKVELARKPAKRNLGLMYRKRLPPMKGMLFIFENEAPRSFTMSNTQIALDMIFLDSSRQVLGWIENARPYSRGPYRFGKPARYVLEVNAFFCKKHGLAAGDKVSFHNF